MKAKKTAQQVRKDNEEYITGKPANFGQPGCQCQHCQGVKVNSSKHILNNVSIKPLPKFGKIDLNLHGDYKTAAVFAKNELNRVSLPGDVDYPGSLVTPQVVA